MASQKSKRKPLCKMYRHSASNWGFFRIWIKVKIMLWVYLQHNPWQQTQEHHELSAQSQPPIPLHDEVIPRDVEPGSSLHFPSRTRSASGTTPAPESNHKTQFYNWKYIYIATVSMRKSLWFAVCLVRKWRKKKRKRKFAGETLGTALPSSLAWAA